MIAAATSAALASSETATTAIKPLDDFTVSYATEHQAPVVAAAAFFLKPKVGVRVGGGEWKSPMLDGGVDVTFNVPLIPLPALRVDGEVWGKFSNFGKDDRGNAVSVLAIQTFMLGYAGVGPTFYFTDRDDVHKSGFGAKLLAGMNLPGGAYVEAGLLVGPNNLPIFVTAGVRF